MSTAVAILRGRQRMGLLLSDNPLLRKIEILGLFSSGHGEFQAGATDVGVTFGDGYEFSSGAGSRIFSGFYPQSLGNVFEAIGVGNNGLDGDFHGACGNTADGIKSIFDGASKNVGPALDPLKGYPACRQRSSLELDGAQDVSLSGPAPGQETTQDQRQKWKC